MQHISFQEDSLDDAMIIEVIDDSEHWQPSQDSQHVITFRNSQFGNIVTKRPPTFGTSRTSTSGYEKTEQATSTPAKRPSSSLTTAGSKKIKTDNNNLLDSLSELTSCVARSYNKLLLQLQLLLEKGYASPF